MGKNIRRNDDDLIGYAAFEIQEECYEYNENACYIADTHRNIKEFLKNAMLPISEYRIDKVSFSDLINDFGCSSGEYALEEEALKRFERLAKLSGTKYEVEQYEDYIEIDSAPKLFIVNIYPHKTT
jgi:hypothetical protein